MSYVNTPLLAKFGAWLSQELRKNGGIEAIDARLNDTTQFETLAAEIGITVAELTGIQEQMRELLSSGELNTILVAERALTYLPVEAAA